jgi:FkbM family methyltransferase
LTRLDIDCVLDVGANVGQFGNDLRKIGYAGRIVSFEPIPECFAALERRSSTDDGWSAINCALGNATGSARFNVMARSEFSSFLLPGGDNSLYYQSENSVVSTIDIPVLTLDEILPKLADDLHCSRFFLKMDTQGFDLNVFNGGRQVLTLILGILSEISLRHLYEGTPSWHDAIDEYRTAGYGLQAMHAVNPETPSHDEVLEFNAYFAKVH